MSFLFENPHFVNPSAWPHVHYGNSYPRYVAEDDMYGSPFGPFWQPAYGRPSHHDSQQPAYLQAMRARAREQAEHARAQRQTEELEQAHSQRYLEQLLKHMPPHSTHVNAHVDMPPEDHPTPMDVVPDTPASTPAAMEACNKATPTTHTIDHLTQSKLRNHRPTKAERHRQRQAATTIQRWWRGVQAQRDTAMPDATAVTTCAGRREEAARVITRAVRKVAAQKTNARALGQIQKLSGIVAEADALRAEFYDKIFTKPVYNDKGKVNYALLGYVDMLEKLILRTDDIPTYGQVRVRQQRKATVRHIQSLLDEADSYRQGGPQPVA